MTLPAPAPEEPLPIEVADYRLELTRFGWIVEGQHTSGDITITVLKNREDVNSIDDYSWKMKLKEFFLRMPERPGNYEIKYDSRHYSSSAPFPLAH